MATRISKVAVAALPGSATGDPEKKPLRNQDQRNALSILGTLALAVTVLVLSQPAVAASWTPTGSLKTARYGHTATLLNDGRVLAAAGYGIIDLASAELYDPGSGSWTPTGNLKVARFGHSATLRHDGKVLVVGGYNSSDFLASAELYSGTWDFTASLSQARYFHTATRLLGGAVLVAGGGGQGIFAMATAQIYTLALIGEWINTGSLSQARRLHTATLMNDGRVLVAGGIDLTGPGIMASAEIFNPAGSGSWSGASPLSQARHSHTATLLADGRVLVVGGRASGFYPFLASVEIYNPDTNTWSGAASLRKGRCNHSATRLPNGKVLVAGGYNGDPLIEAELYDPVSNSWSATEPLKEARESHTATLLANGKVLAAGGYGIGDSALASAELYPPTPKFAPYALNLLLQD